MILEADIIMAVIRKITRMVRDMTTTPADHATVVAVMMPIYKNTKSSMSKILPHAMI
jgi:hypothetical protein